MARLIDHLRLVAIDLDGTLIDTKPDLAAAANAVLSSRGLPALPADRVAEFIGHGTDTLVRRVLEERGQAPTETQLKAAVVQFRDYYRDQFFVHSRVYPGVVEGLTELRRAGTSICCVTNKISDFTEPLLRVAQLDQFMDAVFCADQPEQRKPGPWLLHQACQHFGLAMADLLLVGDSGNDIAAARAAGCRVVAVDYGYNHGRPVADNEPDWIISSLADLVRLPAGSERASQESRG